MRRYCSYKDLMPTLKTGDIMLAHGTEATSKVIEAVELSEWSHVCMIVQGKDIGLNDEVLIWESSDSEDLVNVLIEKQSKPGPMLVRFEDRIESDHSEKTDSKFALRRLISPCLDSAHFTVLKRFMVTLTNKGAGFPSLKDLAEELFEGRFKNKVSSSDSYFCSELVAHTLIKIGLLSTEYVVNGYTPADFDENNKGKCPWIDRVSFAEQIYFK